MSARKRGSAADEVTRRQGATIILDARASAGTAAVRANDERYHAAIIGAGCFQGQPAWAFDFGFVSEIISSAPR